MNVSSLLCLPSLDDVSHSHPPVPPFRLSAIIGDLAISKRSLAVYRVDDHRDLHSFRRELEAELRDQGGEPIDNEDLHPGKCYVTSIDGQLERVRVLSQSAATGDVQVALIDVGTTRCLSRASHFFHLPAHFATKQLAYAFALRCTVADDVILDAIGAPSMCAFSLYEKVVLTVTSTLEPCVVLVESASLPVDIPRLCHFEGTSRTEQELWYDLITFIGC